MELDYLKELLDKQKELDDRFDKQSDVVEMPGFTPEQEQENLDTLGNVGEEIIKNDSDLDALKAQDEYNAAADAATYQDTLNSVVNPPAPEVPPMSPMDKAQHTDLMYSLLKDATIKDRMPEQDTNFQFDGSLQSNGDDHKYDELLGTIGLNPEQSAFQFDGSLQSNAEDHKYDQLMEAIGMKPVQSEEPMMTEGVSNPIPTDQTQKSTKEIKPKVDIMPIVKQLKKANPDKPLSELMEEAQRRADQREADLWYYKAAMGLLNVGNKGKVDTDLADKLIKDSDKFYKNELGRAIQKDKENREKGLLDPNSSISKTMRDIAQKLGIKMDNQTTARELMDAGLKLNTLMGLKSNNDIATMNAMVKNNLDHAKYLRQLEKDSNTVKRENKKYFLDMEQRLEALKRGSSFKDMDTTMNAVAQMRYKLDNALNGTTPLNQASAHDLSTVWSRALTGGIPASSLIEQTLPTSIKSQFAKAINYMANKPEMDFISRDNMKLMRDQLKILEEAINIRKGEKLASVYNAYTPVINSDPKFQEIIMRNHSKFVRRNKDGYYEPIKTLTQHADSIGKRSKKSGDKSKITKQIEAEKPSLQDNKIESNIQRIIENAKKRNVVLTREEAMNYLKRKGIL